MSSLQKSSISGSSSDDPKEVHMDSVANFMEVDEDTIPAVDNSLMVSRADFDKEIRTIGG